MRTLAPYKPVSANVGPAWTIRVFHWEGSVCSSVSVFTFTIIEDVGCTLFSLERNIATTFETNFPDPSASSWADWESDGVRRVDAADGGRFRATLRGCEWAFDRGEGPSVLTWTSVDSPSGVVHRGVSESRTAAAIS